jgi:hypothetical protein
MISKRSERLVTSSSSADTSRIAQPSHANSTSLPVNKLDRADIDTARRLRHQQQLRIDAILTTDDQLLLIATGNARAGSAAFGGRTSKP